MGIENNIGQRHQYEKICQNQYWRQEIARKWFVQTDSLSILQLTSCQILLAEL
jgi:hypothetical protein